MSWVLLIQILILIIAVGAVTGQIVEKARKPVQVHTIVNVDGKKIAESTESL